MATYVIAAGKVWTAAEEFTASSDHPLDTPIAIRADTNQTALILDVTTEELLPIFCIESGSSLLDNGTANGGCRTFCTVYDEVAGDLGVTTGQSIVYCVDGQLYARDEADVITLLTTGAAGGLPNPGIDDAVLTSDGAGGAVPESGLTFDGNTLLITSADISNTGGQSSSEVYGANATVAAGAGTALGNGASVTAVWGTAVGQGATAGQGAIAVGQAADASATEAIAIGSSVTAALRAVVIGVSASGGSATTAVGYQASSAGVSSTAIGNAASAANTDSTAVGQGATASGLFSTVIGQNCTGASNATVLGHDAVASSSCIVLGARGPTNTAGNQFVAGSGTIPMTDVFFGKGVVNSSPTDYAINGTAGSGTNIAGGTLTIAGGKGTGDAAGGAVAFATSDPIASGATLQSLTEKGRFDTSGNLLHGTTTSPTGTTGIVFTQGDNAGLPTPGINTECQGATDRSGTVTGFHVDEAGNVYYIEKQSTYTQTYATTSTVHAALTSSVLTDSTGGTANTTVVAVPPVNGSGATTAQEAAINDNFADLIAQINALRADLENAKQIINRLIDDQQVIGFAG